MTTPGSLAKADVLKGIEMFETLNIPTICAVENMSYFRNPVNDEKHYLLGTPISHEEMSLESEADLVRIPMSEAVSKANDDGVPVALLGTAEEVNPKKPSKKYTTKSNSSSLRFASLRSALAPRRRRPTRSSPQFSQGGSLTATYVPPPNPRTPRSPS